MSDENISNPTPNPPPGQTSALPDPHAALRPRRGRRYWLLGGVLTLACLVLRVIHLLALPIFGDESIYLRWAQLIRGEAVSGGMHLWVSLADPKPPLHFWLLAGVFHWTADTLLAARLVSVLAGVACVPVMMAVGVEFGHFLVPRDKQISGRGLGALAAVLGIFCPFLAFYQRLATADALFTAESLVIVWLSLRWARLVFDGGGKAWLAAAALGVAIGAGLLTRQGVSYTICAMPLAAWLVHASTRMDAWARQAREQAGTAEQHAFDADMQAKDAAQSSVPPETNPPSLRQKHGTREERQVLRFWMRGLAQLSLAGLIALALWTPYLTAELHARAREAYHPNHPEAPVTHGELLAEVKQRIMFRSDFTRAEAGQLALARRNALAAYIPGWNEDGNPNSGWLPLYLTPLVCAMCLAGLVYTVIRQRQMAFLLVVWVLVMQAPVVLLVENIYSRYLLAGVPPLLFAGALLLGDTTVLLRGVKMRALGWMGAAVLWGGLLWMPVREVGIQLFDWTRQTLTYTLIYKGQRVTSDRYQYLTGWTAGCGTQDAIHFLQRLARAHPDQPMVIVTTNAWGTPADAVWVYLSQEPNVRLYFTDARTILRPGVAPGTYLLKDDKWLFPPERPVHIAPNVPVYFVTNDPVHADVDVPAWPYYRSANPNLSAPRSFNGIEGAKGEGAAVFLVPRQ